MEGSRRRRESQIVGRHYNEGDTTVVVVRVDGSCCWFESAPGAVHKWTAQHLE